MLKEKVNEVLGSLRQLATVGVLALLREKRTVVSDHTIGLQSHYAIHSPDTAKYRGRNTILIKSSISSVRPTAMADLGKITPTTKPPKMLGNERRYRAEKAAREVSEV